jgi:hypothetical protein
LYCARAVYNGYQAYRAEQKPKEEREAELRKLELTDPEKAAAERKADQEKREAHKKTQDLLLKRHSVWDYFKFDSTIMLENQRRRMDDLERDLLKLEFDCRNNNVDIKAEMHDKLLDKERQLDAKGQRFASAQNLRNAYHFLNFGMTGAFVARTIFIRGLTAFLLPGLAAAVCLSNPITIGILVGAFVAWGFYKYYTYRKAQNEQKMKETNKRIQLVEAKKYLLECRLQQAKKNKVEAQATATVASTTTMGRVFSLNNIAGAAETPRAAVDASLQSSAAMIDRLGMRTGHEPAAVTPLVDLSPVTVANAPAVSVAV